MKFFRNLVFAFCPVLIFSFAVCAQTVWIGTYEFNEDGGKTADGTPIVADHVMDILETEDGLIAVIQSSGYQTLRDLVGLAKPNGDKLEIVFESYGENNVFENYKKGDLLFTLERKTYHKTTEILTTWGKFQPVVPKNEKPGKVYFVLASDESEPDLIL